MGVGHGLARAAPVAQADGGQYDEARVQHRGDQQILVDVLADVDHVSAARAELAPLVGEELARDDVVRQFEVAAGRVARPFADPISWSRGLVDAKNDNKKLRAENEALRRQLILDEGALQENVELRKALNYIGPPSVADFNRIDTSVVANPQSALDESIVIGAGSSDGVQLNSVVVEPLGGPDGTGALVGTVNRVTSHASRVTLLTDSESAVTATDLTSPQVIGAVRRGGGSSDVLILDRVPKRPVVRVGDTIITAGSLGTGPLKSKFPRGIPIGTVSSESSADTSLFQSIQLKPFVDFSSIQSVVVLVPKR